MPSRHSRIGLVVDESVASALSFLREVEQAPDARLVRRAVFEGALIEAVVEAAGGRSASRDRAGDLLAELREFVPRLPAPMQADLLELFEQGLAEAASDERRQRQREAIGLPNPHGRAALDYADTFDAVDSVPR